MATGQHNNAKRLPVTLTDSEVEALLGVVYTTSTTGLRNRTMLQVMLGAGLRVSEVCNLRGVDVDLASGTIRVNLGKGRKDRVVPVDAETLGWLRAWAERRQALGLNARGPFFFGLRTGHRPLTPRYLQALVARLARAAGIEKHVTPHTLRHTYATRMLGRPGFTIRDVQTLLGHSNVATTQVYTHVNEEELRRKVQAQPPASSPSPAAADLANQLAQLPKEKLVALLAEALSSSPGDTQTQGR